MLLVCSLLCWVYILLACGGGCWLGRRSHFYCHWKPGNPARQVEEDRCNHQITHVKPTQDMGNIIAHSTVSVSASNTHTCIVLPLPELAMWTPFRGEPEEGNKTGGPVGSGDTSLIFPVAWPPQCSRSTHLWACKTHEMREVGYGL